MDPSESNIKDRFTIQKIYFLTGMVLFLIILESCRSTRITRPLADRYKVAADDSTLYADQAPYIMPYNRVLDPAGVSVPFGDGNYENHSLDAITLADGKTLVVEDRYGLAVFDIHSRKLIDRWTFNRDSLFSGLMSSYSGITSIVHRDSTFIFWGAGGRNIVIGAERANSFVMQASWDGKKIRGVHSYPFQAEAPARIALPNQVIAKIEEGELYFYTVLNGNNKIVKVRVRDRQTIWETKTGMAPFGLEIIGDFAYVTNWAGPVPGPDSVERAGIPWGEAYTDPVTGAVSRGSVSVVNIHTGRPTKEIEVGLHPNAILSSPDKRFLYVANGNSDFISVIQVSTNSVTDSIPVGLFGTEKGYIGSTPNALAVNQEGNRLYVSNGLDNAICIIDLEETPSGKNYRVLGYIPTEAYPSGIVLHGDQIIVTNLESTGARASRTVQVGDKNSKSLKTFNSHHQLASISFIPLPGAARLKRYTEQVKKLSMAHRLALTQRLPRPNIAPKPVPERIGEPSVFQHVLYIIKENRTYDQVLGDMPEGRGMPSLCIFGDSITPNQHQIARDYVLLDNYHVSGKGSAEGHHWASAGMVTDYTEKSVRAWFRSYPHVLNDAMVYNKKGFIWNNALDHGKTVRIYGEACTYEYDKSKYNWKTVYELWENGRSSELAGKSTTTISRVRPILSQNFPGGDDQNINEQMRADAFIKELNEFSALPGDQLPNLMIMALPNDHTAGTSPAFPTPRSMVADNDLAVGRIVEAVMSSRFAENTVIFISEDDSQSGWDHLSSYRTTGFVVSAYSRLKKTVQTNYNQTSMLRTMEQILGLPPMNVIDATALPMFDCFSDRPDYAYKYKTIKNRIPLNEMNPQRQNLQGADLKFSDQSVKYMVHLIDRGHDDILNRILWRAVKRDLPYPDRFAGESDNED